MADFNLESVDVSFERVFTLIELMVSIVIIGILASLAVPNFSKLQDKAKETSVVGLVRSLQVSVESYSLVFGMFPNGVNIDLVTLLLDINEESVFMAVPKNPYTGELYSSDDSLGKIMYSYETDNNLYTITGYGRGDGNVVVRVSNQ